MKNLLKQTITSLIAVALLTSFIPRQSVYAAFPGQNGKVAYGVSSIDFESSTFTSGIADINLNGSSQRELLNATWHGNFDSSTRAPRYSADGTKLTYSFEQASYQLDIYTMNADGTNQQNVTNLPFDDGRFAMYSSFHPSGESLTYGELWNQTSNWYGDIFTINQDGSNKQQLTASDPDYCNVYPVFSPDGSKIAFYRGDRNADTGGIWVMNADGSNQQEVIQVPTIDGCWFNSIPVGSIGDAGLVSNFDWSPDGTRLAYIRTIIGGDPQEVTSSLRTVDLQGNEEIIYEVSSIATIELVGFNEGSLLSGVQYTPEGDLIFRTVNIEADGAAVDGMRITSLMQSLNIDGTGLMTIISDSGEGATGLFSAFGLYSLPTVQPLAVSEGASLDQGTLTSGAGTLASTGQNSVIMTALALFVVCGAGLYLNSRHKEL